MTSPLVLLLSDARFPSGGHAHSGGMEQACDCGLVTDLESLASFLRGRLLTAGVVAAHAAALVCSRPDSWLAVDAELDTRMAAPAARAVSRQQGAQLLRAARSVFPSPVLERVRACDCHQSVALGLVASVAGLEPCDAAVLAAFASVSGPASAALRLLGLDPSGVSRVLAEISPEVDAVARAARPSSPRRLPSPSAPMLDLLAEDHFGRRERLFAS